VRVLAVDLGRLRIGIAIGETEFRIATPRPNLAASGTLKRDAEAVSLLAKKEEVERIVVGHPLNVEDERMARVCSQFADLIRDHGWHVELVDESFTSVQADENLADLKDSQRRKRRDGEAAAVILERYFNG
jgi:putative Holliday junction resolvase